MAQYISNMNAASMVFPESFIPGLGRLRGLGEYDAEGNLLAPEDGGWNWQGQLSNVPALLKDLYLAHEQGQAAQRLLEINLERAAQGKPPITAESVAPTVRFGLDAATMQKGLIVAAGLAAAYVLVGALSGRRR